MYLFVFVSTTLAPYRYTNVVESSLSHPLSKAKEVWEGFMVTVMIIDDVVVARMINMGNIRNRWTQLFHGVPATCVRYGPYRRHNLGMCSHQAHAFTQA